MSPLERAAGPSDGQVPPTGSRRFVTTLAPMEQHVGNQVLQHLRGPDTVAVLTAVTVDAGGRQHLVSIGVDGAMLAEVQGLVGRADDDRKRAVPCAGFPVHLAGPGSAPEATP